MRNYIVFLLLLGVILPLYGEQEPIGWWVFDQDHVQEVVQDLAGSHPAAMKATSNLSDDKLQGIILDNTSAVIGVKNIDASLLPRRDITVTAWVELDAGTEWGGIAGYLQDNGNYEKGWILGYRKDNFSWAVSSHGKLTYMTSKTKFVKGRWYHLAGTYDGRVMKIYVNGKLEAQSTEQSGDIDYPPKAYFTLGAYRDDDELYRMQGKLHEVRLYNQALAANAIQQEFQAKEQFTYQPLVFKRKPFMKFTSPDSGILSWELPDAVPAKIQYGVKGQTTREITINKRSTRFDIPLKKLHPHAVYTYRIIAGEGNNKVISKNYSFETAFDFTVYPVKDNLCPYPRDARYDLYRRAAQRILRETGVTKGYALVYGCERGELAYELARQSDLMVICVDTDKARIAEIRKLLYKGAVYGVRITARQVKAMDELPFTSNFINLLVSESMLTGGQFSGAAKEVMRVLRPGGGVAYLGVAQGSTVRLAQWLKTLPAKCRVEQTENSWVKIIKPALKGIGVWSHQYGLADNAGNGGDTLLGVTSTDDLETRWIGRPGADFGLDRNPRMPAPLSINGRLFHQGMNRLAALDAYNGAILWSLEIPHLRRVNMPRDASNWCADNDYLYVEVGGQCWKLDAYTGRLVTYFDIPDKSLAKTHGWGYVARHGQFLYGSSVKNGSVYTDFWGHDTWYDETKGFGTGKVCSDDLFAYDLQSGKQAWRYIGGVIINTTIAIGADRVYFVESRQEDLQKLPTGRISSPELWREQYLVALDARSGKKLWEQSIDTVDGIDVFYLVYSDGMIVITSSQRPKYYLYGFDANSGRLTWENSHKWTGDNHGGHLQHPVCVGGRIFQEPYGYDLKTGQRMKGEMGRHEGCATYAAVSGALIYRGTGRRVAMWDINTGKVTSWFNLRPSCWLSVIPAEGMVLAPEGGGGCSCGNWLETSLGFAPRYER